MEDVRRLCREGRLEQVLEAIQQQRIPLSKDVLYSLLLASIARKDIQAARNIESLLSCAGFYNVSVLADHLIRLFALCGSLSEANSVFEKVPKPSVYTWNSIISAHVKLREDEKALALLEAMQVQGTRPDGVTFSCLIKACGSLRAVHMGKLLHFHILESGCDAHVITESTLVDFYAKCGYLQEARKIFDGMEERDVVTWGTIIAAYTQHGDGFSALELFHEMQLANIKPSMVVFSSVLKSCGSIQALQQGRLIHEQIRSSGFLLDVVVGSSLVDMYAKCGSIKEARSVFDEMKIRDLVMWGTMICAYVANDDLHIAFHLFDCMQLNGISPNNVVFESLLRACSTIKHIEHVKRLHCYMVILGLNNDPRTNFTLADVYAKVGIVDEAEKVFLELPSPNVQSWDAFMARNVEHGNDDFVLKLFNKMQEIGVVPDRSTILHLLKACEGAVGCLQKCMLLHHHILRHELDAELVIASALLDFYAKCGCIESAEKIFEGMPNPDVVAWGALIQGYVHRCHSCSALEAFEKMMRKSFSPSKVIFSSVSKACGSLGSLESGRWIHDQVIREACEDDVIVGSSLIDMYAKCGHLLEAQSIFLKLPCRDPTAWGSIIAGCSANGNIFSVFEYFEQMQQEGFNPDKVVFSCLINACGCMGDICRGRIICDQIIRSGVAVDIILENSVIDMYTKCGSLDEAQKLFDGFKDKDIVSWGAMITAYVVDGHNYTALKLFEQMQKEGVRPNKVVFLSCLKACGAAGYLLWGRLIHDQVVRTQLDTDRAIGNTLVDVYGKLGSSCEAYRVLDALPSQDPVSWASMISGLSLDGKFSLAKECLEVMQKHGLKPVDTNFISVISSCTHAGMLKEGIDCFGDMSEDHGISPNLELFSCMVNLLGRTGCQREAEDLIQTMPNSPDDIAWTSLLTSCKTFGYSNCS
ncbi:hypothetical protein GOP47_0025247 [Adiantum capillus-veneris]|uniref:Pentatricopeptide repeat-containing protein n=1 Tax=Adiantum capillus-veneris TaxID=13818 RepID=A0A9D4Z267_ADICA|nr:hypothetical protein GOP47_0025247 [Adiantum capillus-veneris]